MDAARAGAAMVGDEGRIGFEREVKQNFGYEKIGTLLGINETSIFADPADARALSEVTFENWASVCIVTVLYWTSNLRLNELNEFLHPSRDDIVIISALSVGGDASLTFVFVRR